jgi:hypothetical protein
MILKNKNMVTTTMSIYNIKSSTMLDQEITLDGRFMINNKKSFNGIDSGIIFAIH